MKHSLTVILPSGISKLRFKPAYNPYTEPSMEIFSYHEGAGTLRGVGELCSVFLGCLASLL